MNAGPVLAAVARALRRQKLEAVLIGNAAAALQGAPVTTVDLDFLIRRTAANERKLRDVAAALEATLFRPEYPASNLIRLARDEDGLQVDFMTAIHGVNTFNSIRSRATEVEVEGERLRVAALVDIIASKRAANRPRDRAVLDVLEKTLREREKPSQKTPEPGGNS